MSKLQNERGFALVATLLIITLLILLLLSQFYVATNTTKQIATMGSSIESRHMADMGIKYYKQVLQTNNEALQSAVEADGADPVKQLKDKVQTMHEEIERKVFVEGNERYFEIDKDINIEETDAEIKVEFISRGIADGKETTETGEINITIVEN